MDKIDLPKKAGISFEILYWFGVTLKVVFILDIYG